MSIKRIEPGRRLSQAVVANGFVFLAGQVSESGSTSVREQTVEVLAAIDRLLGLAGSSKERIVSATIYLASMSSFAEMNAAWEPWVAEGPKPARATVEARLAAPSCLVEIQVIALQ